MSDCKQTGELEFSRKDWFDWKKRPILEYGQNQVRVSVKEITNLVPSSKKSRDEWESWKKKACDAGFLPGQEMVVEEGKKLVKGKIYCFAAIDKTLTCIWGMTYNAWFPWCHRERSGAVIEKDDGAFEELKMLGYCGDRENTVVFEIEKIDKSKGKAGE